MRRGTAVCDRVLNDDEIRAVWHAADTAGSAGAFIQFALLCGQRYAKIATMRWDDLSGDTWTVRQVAREKTAGGVLRLPPAALAIIERQPHIVSTGTVFGPFHNRTLARLRAACGVQGWHVHDCCCMWCSLASGAGVSREHAERVLGHAVGSAVEQTYDRHDFIDQKSRALAAVAHLIENILSPPTNNIIAIGGV